MAAPGECRSKIGPVKRKLCAAGIIRRPKATLMNALLTTAVQPISLPVDKRKAEAGSVSKRNLHATRVDRVRHIVVGRWRSDLQLPGSSASASIKTTFRHGTRIRAIVLATILLLLWNAYVNSDIRRPESLESWVKHNAARAVDLAPAKR